MPKMTFLDIFLQQQRIAKAMTAIEDHAYLLDIGCNEGALFTQASLKNIKGIGIDPYLTEEKINNAYTLLPLKWQELEAAPSSFDAITMLAVLEHIPALEQPLLVQKIFVWLKPGGKLIITVPHKKVDTLLKILRTLKLVKGMQLEEHYGFETATTENLFTSGGFQLQKHETFQWGLNNLFIFLKPSV